MNIKYIHFSHTRHPLLQVPTPIHTCPLSFKRRCLSAADNRQHTQHNTAVMKRRPFYTVVGGGGSDECLLYKWTAAGNRLFLCVSHSREGWRLLSNSINKRFLPSPIYLSPKTNSLSHHLYLSRGAVTCEDQT